MPATINGVGTRYVGKSNLSVRTDICEHCGREATVSTYDTRLWFCFLFIPIVPLGKKRIVDDCSRCRRHRAMPLEAYRRFQSETLEQLGADTRSKPGDAAAALAYNAALFEFDKPEEGLEHLTTLLRSFPSDADVQFYAGVVYERTGRPDEATRFFDRAFELDSSHAPARRAKAIQCIEEDRLQEARSLLFGANAADAADPTVLYCLGEAFQKRSDHVTALEIFRRLLDDYPGIGQQKAVRKAIQQSEKAMQAHGSMLPGRRFPWGKLALPAALAVALGAGIFGTNTYSRSHCPVHIVNGYTEPVTVEVGGEVLASVPGSGRITIKIPEGRHEAKIGGALDETIGIEISRSFLERFGSGSIFVVNPGGLGVLISEKTVYSSGVVRDFDPGTRLVAGRRFVTFRDVDYPFKEFPESLEVSSSSSRVTKSRVGTLEGDPGQLATWLLSYGKPRDAVDYLESWLSLAPDDSLVQVYSFTALVAGQGGRAAEFLRPRLTLDPVNIEWHRSYQRVMEPDEDGIEKLIAEYDSHLAGAPNDSMLLYLRGRVDNDPRGAQALYSRALAQDGSNLYARRASAYVSNALGRFDATSTFLSAAPGAQLADGSLTELYFDALTATGRYERLERELQPWLEGPSEELDWSKARRLVLSLAGRGRADEAREVIDEIAAREAQSAGQPALIGAWLRAHLLYADGNWKGLRNQIRRQDFPELWRDTMGFWVAVEEGDVGAANNALARVREPAEGGLNALVMSLLYARAGLSGLSEEWLHRALGELHDQAPANRVFEGLLAGGLEVTNENLDRLVTSPDVKAALLTILALRLEEQRSWLLREADRFNFSPTFPYHFLRSFQS